MFDRLRSWNKYDGNQNMKKSVESSTAEFSKLRKQIELLGIEVEGLDEKAETGRLELKTKFINQHFINELDKIGLQFELIMCSDLQLSYSISFFTARYI